MERIRLKRGDPLIEFDGRGNKIFVKSVALAAKSGQSSQQQQLSVKDGPETHSINTAQKALEKRMGNEISSLQKSKSKKKQQQISSQPDQALLTNVLQLNDSIGTTEKMGSDTVKITGSLLT